MVWANFVQNFAQRKPFVVLGKSQSRCFGAIRSRSIRRRISPSPMA